jgi:four helix bundle protein
MNHTSKRITRFDAYDVALEIIRALRPLVPQIKAKDAGLAKQIREAASSIPLNVKEGWRRLGNDRRYHYSVAAGSADEVSAALDSAAAWGYLEEVANTQAQQLLDRELAMLYRLTH